MSSLNVFPEVLKHLSFFKLLKHIHYYENTWDNSGNRCYKRMQVVKLTNYSRTELF